jgi:FKBP-type peptidyl-prolyl cis-trans isomerase (trigger factor)
MYLAREITKSEASPLTLAELSNRVRENIQLQRQKELNSRYVESVIHEIVQQAVFRFPEGNDC